MQPPKKTGTRLELATYEAGLIQAQAYRALRTHLTRALAGHGLSMSEWALLGQVHARRSLRLSELAEILSVESPLATNLVSGLVRKGLVARHRDPDDSRAKQVRLTATGRNLVPRLEKTLRADLRSFLGDVSSPHLAIYLGVLRKIAAKG